MPEKASLKGQPDVFRAALLGLCPQCGAKTLYAGAVGFSPKCGDCGLDYSGFNVGDGPAALLTLVVGAVITGLALTVEVMFSPPFWFQLLIWLPLTAVAVVGSLRVCKGALLILEHRNQAREARSVPVETET